jgi:hypothetical protein
MKVAVFRYFLFPFVEFWKHGDGDMRHGDMETWRHGDMETWRHGDMETWRQGGMETRRHEDVGDMETQRHQTEYGSTDDLP